MNDNHPRIVSTLMDIYTLMKPWRRALDNLPISVKAVRLKIPSPIYARLRVLYQEHSCVTGVSHPLKYRGVPIVEVK